jgi:hypothetical protein
MENISTLLANQLHNGISSPINNMETFQFAWALSAMKPLKFGFLTSFFRTMASSFLQSIHWALMSFDYILHIAIDITLP